MSVTPAILIALFLIAGNVGFEVVSSKRNWGRASEASVMMTIAVVVFAIDFNGRKPSIAYGVCTAGAIFLLYLLIFLVCLRAKRRFKKLEKVATDKRFREVVHRTSCYCYALVICTLAVNIFNLT